MSDDQKGAAQPGDGSRQEAPPSPRGLFARLNAFATKPLGTIIMTGIFQVFVFGVFLNYADSVVSARTAVREAAEEKHAEMQALKNELLTAASAYRNAARRAQRALSTLRFDRFRQIMGNTYPRARERWLALEPQAVQRWAAIHGHRAGAVFCPEGAESPVAGCAALREWLGGAADVPADGVWSVKRRLFVINQILTGSSTNRMVPDRTRWVRCREQAEAVFAPRRAACLAGQTEALAQHSCLATVEADLDSFQRTHCLSSQTAGGDLRTRVFCLLEAVPAPEDEKDCRRWVGMDGYTDTDRPDPDPLRVGEPHYAKDRLSMAAWQAANPGRPVNLEETLAEALRLTDIAADRLAFEACQAERDTHWLAVKLFVPACRAPGLDALAETQP